MRPYFGFLDVFNFMKALGLYLLSVKFRLLMKFIRFVNEELESKLIVKSLEDLQKSEKNTLSETTVAIVASGLKVPTTAKRKKRKTPTKKSPRRRKKKRGSSK